MQAIARYKIPHSQVYGPAHDLGKLNAAEGSRTSSGKRVVRRRVLRTSNGVVQRGLRRFGLWR